MVIFQEVFGKDEKKYEKSQTDQVWPSNNLVRYRSFPFYKYYIN